MNDQKRRYVHICGKSGLNFALWLYQRLEERGMEPVLVDCSVRRELKEAAMKLTDAGAVVPAEKWAVQHVRGGQVLFYHEQEDLYTDQTGGMYLLFAAQDHMSYAKLLLDKLTDGRLCLFEPILAPQLQQGRRTYLLILYNRHTVGEYYIPTAFLDAVPGPFEELFLQILSKNVLPYLVS